MKIYFSIFVTGTQEVIKDLLEKRKAKIKLLLDGLVVYESDYPEREVRNFRFFNNTFILLRSFENLKPDTKAVEKILSTVVNDKSTKNKIVANLPNRRKNFKIVTSLENQTVAVDRNLLQKLEAVIFQASNLRLNVKKPDLEFWVLVRREGYGFFGIRTTYPYRDENQRDKGKLRSEIAHIMNVLSEPTPKDIVLDPFAGYGAIPNERAQSFPLRKVWAIEKDERLVSNLKQQVKREKKSIDVRLGDALNLKDVENSSIDKIVTDPPWGTYEKTEIPLNEFYKKMMAEFLRVLKPNGTIVLLIGQTEVFGKSIAEFSNQMKVEKQYPILVSGQKATIYKLKKNIENKANFPHA